MENPEFRELLVYACPEINDSNLAKRDKIHNMIVNASVDYMEVLKKQLGVCFSSLKSFTLFTYIYNLFSRRWVKSVLQRICGQKRIDSHFMPLRLTGYIKRNQMA